MVMDPEPHKKPHSGQQMSRGLSRLTVEAITGVTHMVESLHQTIARLGNPTGPSKGPTGKLYSNIRTITQWVGGGLDELLSGFGPLLDKLGDNPGSEAIVSALNGVLGDHLVARNNPLAIPMKLRRKGKTLDAEALNRFVGQTGGHLLILVHGSCMNDLQWLRKGHSHGAALARDLGFATLYLHYNTGRHVSENGRQFADLLQCLMSDNEKPASITILTHSMGGLVSRSACYYAQEAGHSWLNHLTKMAFLGTPHHGAPLEKGGNHIDALLELSPFSAPFARLGKIRSSGITDLRYGYVVDEDWKGKDRFEFLDEDRRIVPLPSDVACYALAASKSKTGSLAGDHLLGDGLVPVYSALGRHLKPELQFNIPEDRQWVGRKMNHFDLLNDPQVYETLKNWLAPVTRP